MITEKLKELEALKSKTAALELAVQAELNAALAALPAQFGFDNASKFVAAVLAATGGKLKLKRAAKKKAANKSRGVRRRRAVITDETRSEVKKLFEAGKTGAQIAKALKISLPSVANIKKAQGLVKKRG